MVRSNTLKGKIAKTCLCIALVTNAFAQEQIGLNPPSMKWNKINSPAGPVIFPKGLDSIAFRTAALMNYEREHDASIAGTGRTKRVPVILQNQSTLPAGFSTPAPWRNEYYLTPPQNMFLGPVPWMDGMPLHEYRHTQQFYMASQGLGWIYRILMGQTGWLFNSLMTQPLWFREGDAVVGETIFTKGGRGRLPSFHMEYRAMRMAGYHYSYEKAHYSSFRDFVPNPYRIGYYMVTKARKDFGPDIWTKVLFDTYHRKGFIYPFSRSLRKFTGRGTKQFYNETVADLDSLWKATDAHIAETAATAITTPRTSKYTSYRFPHYVRGGGVLTLKSGLDVINTYYVIKDGKERKLFCPGLYTDDHITTVVEGNLMTWAESGFDERWINRDYSIIKSYDFETGKITKLTSKTRYFSPAPSKDGHAIIVSETDTHNRYTLVLLDAATGRVMKRLPNPSNYFFTHMRWQDDRFVVSVIVDGMGNALARIDTQTGDVEKLTEETAVPLSRPFPSGDVVFFSAGSDGINNIYALKTASADLFQITHVRFGAFEPVVSDDGKKMLYSEYTADGYRVKEITLAPESWRMTTLSDPGDITFHEPLLRQEGEDLVSLPSPAYPVDKYHALTSGLFNFYGWIPLPNIPEYGLEVYTRNLMSTLRGTIGYAYNTNEDRGRYYARLTYAALYPYIELNLNKGLRRSANVSLASGGAEFFEQEWRENSVSAGLRFPFRLTQGTHETHLEAAAFYEYYDIHALDSADVSMETASTHFEGFHGSLLFSRLRTQARQQVKPRWGQELRVDYQKAFDAAPKRLSASSLFYFPGLFRTHSLNFRVTYKKEQVVDTWRYTDDFMMPRGYEPMPYRDISVGSINYELPLWYPDISAGSVVFFQRVRTNLFADYAEGRTGDFMQPMTSAGGELFIDLRLFRLFQTTLAFRFNAPFDDPVAGTIPFQFLITRFELAN